MKQAVYPGSFDPITNGHIDIIERALSVFDHIKIVVLTNVEKNYKFSFQERVSLIRDVFHGNEKITVDFHSGLLVNYLEKNSIFTVIRGLRAISDFDYEFQMAITNKQLFNKMDSIFFMTDIQNSYLSSSLIKQIHSFGGDVSKMVPPVVLKKLRKIK